MGAVNWKSQPLHGFAGFKRGGEGALVEIIELAANRHAMREPRDRDVAAGELIHQVMRG